MVLQVLGERYPDVREIRALASDGQGRRVQFQQNDIPVEPVNDKTLDGVDVVFMAATNAVSERWAPWLRDRGTLVIDKSSRFRMDPAVPLLVPEVNLASVTPQTRLIASPNCSTIQLVMGLKPLWDHRHLERVLVSTYQAVSGTGREAMEVLDRQTEAYVFKQPAPAPEVYSEPIAFNVLAQCDQFGDMDFTAEEWKLMRETSKILGAPLALSATAVRVPVPVGHAESVYVEMDRPATPEDVRQWLRAMPGVKVHDDPQTLSYPTPQVAAGNDLVWIGRVRQDPHRPNGVHLFIVTDNLRKGAATNAVQIMEAVWEQVRL